MYKHFEGRYDRSTCDVNELTRFGRDVASVLYPLLETKGLSLEEGITFRFMSANASRTYGKVRRRRDMAGNMYVRDLGIAQFLWLHGTMDQLFDTMVHELLHCVPETYTDKTAHGDMWYYAAQLVNREWGMRITATVKLGDAKRDILQRSGKKTEDLAVFKCTQCPITNKVKRSSPGYKHMIRNTKCFCGGTIKQIA